MKIIAFKKELYASISSTIKLCTLAMIDFPRFHLDSRISPELELLIEGFLLALENTNEQTALQTPSTFHPLSSSQEASPTANTISAHNLNATYLEQAKTDFMQDLASWELQPKI